MTVWFRVPDTDSDPRPDPRVWCLQDPDSNPLVKDGETRSGSGKSWIWILLPPGRNRERFPPNFFFFFFLWNLFRQVQPWLEEITASKGCKRKLFYNLVTGALRGIDVNRKSGSRSRKRN
jgi:hypothetical protein